jgi:hypothetical protein
VTTAITCEGEIYTQLGREAAEEYTFIGKRVICKDKWRKDYGIQEYSDGDISISIIEEIYKTEKAIFLNDLHTDKN